ncbi:MAG: TRAP transporter small permease [Betaproteobacteria bacterium]|jgi:TRAP-type C4-dicarboxylate transport system permease small subunit
MRRLESGLGLVAAAALFAMMALTLADVLGRKLVGVSLPGSVEITELLMLAVIFVALPLTSLRGEHVIFDLLDSVLPAWLSRAQHRVSNLACVALTAGAAWLVLQRALRASEDGDLTAQLGLPVDVFHYATSGLLLATALVHAALALRAPPETGNA